MHIDNEKLSMTQNRRQEEIQQDNFFLVKESTDYQQAPKVVILEFWKQSRQGKKREVGNIQTEAKFLVPDWGIGGDIVDSGIGYIVAGRPIRQPYDRVNYIPQSGTKIVAFRQQCHTLVATEWGKSSHSHTASNRKINSVTHWGQEIQVKHTRDCIQVCTLGS